MRLTLWIFWVVAGLPLVLVSIAGIGFGLGTVLDYSSAPEVLRLSVPLWLGLGGLAGIIGAAVRLATPAWTLQVQRTKWWVAVIGIALGGCVSVYPIATMFSGPVTAWVLPLVVAPLLGTILFLGTAGIRRRAPAMQPSAPEPIDDATVSSAKQ